MPDDAVTTVFAEKVCQAARLGGCTELEVMMLRQLLQGHEPRTVQLGLRVRALEETLRGIDPGERRDAICARMGLSRRRYYELRKLAGSAAADRTAEL
jgi:hypothetical protein